MLPGSFSPPPSAERPLNWELLFLIGKKFGLTDEQMQICLKDKEIENKILNDRMNGQNKYGIDATPTIIIPRTIRRSCC